MTLSSSQNGLTKSYHLSQVCVSFILSIFQDTVGGSPNRATMLDLRLFFFFFLKGFYPVKEKPALGKQPTQLELGDNNQFLWACEIGSLSVLFNRKYWKRLSLL